LDAFEWAFVGGGGLLAAANIGLEVSRGTLSGELARLRQGRALGFAQLLPYRTLVADGVVRCANGSLLGAFEVEAPSVSSLTDGELEESDTGLATALAVAFDSSCIVHFHETFEATREYMVPQSYPNGVLGFLDSRRAGYFRSGATSRSKHIVTVTWLPPSWVEAGLRKFVTVGEEDVADATAQVRAFEGRMERILGAFRLRSRVHRLGVRRFVDRHGVERAENELLTHLASRIVGERRRIAHPPLGSAINGLLAVPMRGNFDVRIGENETQVVVVKGFPEMTREAVFASVKELGIRYEMSVRFMPLEAAEARGLMKAAVDDWTTAAGASRVVDPQAARKISDAAEAMGAAGDGTLRFGHTSVFFIVRSRDRKAAKRAAQAIASRLTDLMYPAFVTSLTSEDDFFASLPGDGYHGVRRFPLHTLNLVNIFSFHGDSMGRPYADAPQLPPKTVPVAYARNDVGVLRRLHVNNGESTDTIFGIGVGGQGSGKSFSIGMLSAGWLGRIGDVGLTCVEKGGSMYRLVSFLDGAYYRPLSRSQDDLGIALFDGCEEPEDAGFALILLKSMLELRGVAVTPEREEALQFALASMMSAYDREQRNLSAFVELVQEPDTSGAMRLALSRYTEAGGVVGRALDASVDSFAISRITGIELGPLLRLGDPTYIVPILAAILWKARRGVRRLRASTGRPWPWLYMIDEAHALLERTQGCAFVAEMLKEARKENLGMMLFSQDIEHFAGCAIAADIAREAGTGMWFRNSALRHDEIVQQKYAKFGCPPRGVAEIPYLQPQTFGWSERGSGEFAALSWQADRVTQAIIGRSRGGFDSVGDNARVDEFRRRYPATWREELLRFEGVDESTIAEMTRFIEEFDSSKKEEVA